MSNSLASNIKVIVELFMYMYCLAEFFGKKLKISIYASVLIIINLFVMKGIIDFGFPEYFQLLCYVAMLLYGLLSYGESIKVTLVNCFLAGIIVFLLPFLLYLPLYCLFYPNYMYADICGVLADIGGFLIIVLCQHKMKLKNISDFCIKRSKLILTATILILCGLGFELYQIVDKRIIKSDLNFLMIYFVLFGLFLIYEWQKSRMDVERKKAQLEMNRLYYDAYDQLIMLVRERQHDMKNHINTILSLTYTTENYDELVERQKEYCGYVIEQNEKAKLVLSAGNPLISGFLYSKIQEAEKDDIIIDYKVEIDKADTAIPEYELVEMAGILLDNAIEALNNMREKELDRKIYFSIKETADGIEITVANTSPHYEEDMTVHFFEPEYSSKGQNRGIGLSKLKRLIQDRKGDITVYNKIYGNVNYLTFEIKLLNKRR